MGQDEDGVDVEVISTGKLLKIYREDAGLNNEQLAVELGKRGVEVTPERIASKESDKEPITRHEANILAKIFETDEKIFW